MPTAEEVEAIYDLFNTGGSGTPPLIISPFTLFFFCVRVLSMYLCITLWSWPGPSWPNTGTLPNQQPLPLL